LIEQLLAAGRMAPSAMNKQPWKFYVVTNSEIIHTLSNDISFFTNQVPKWVKIMRWINC
jgi:nitroreductase